MIKNELEFYNEIGNWDFSMINCKEEFLTDWDFYKKIEENTNEYSLCLDLGTGAGEKLLKNYPKVGWVIGSDFSEEMIKTANKNLTKSGRKNIKFRVMNNLKMDTPNNYFDLVTARHTVTDPKQIYKTLKPGGYLILRGVDKIDCWALKKMFKRGQTFNDIKPISLKDYEAIIDAGFKDVELIPLHVVEYYKTKEDLYALLLKVPILDDVSEENSDEYQRKQIEIDIFDKYVSENMTNKGIKLIRRYYGIMARK